MRWASRVWLLIMAMVFGQVCQAQVPVWSGQQMLFGAPFSDTSSDQQLFGFSLLEAGSDALPSAFVNRLLTSGTITQSVKDQGFDYLARDNFAGYQWRSGVGYQRKCEKSRYLDFWWVTMETRSQIMSTFSRDLYGLILYGNARYEDEVAVLSGTLHSLATHAIAVGGQTAMPLGNGKLSLNAGIRAIQGKSGQAAEISGQLYTAPNGAYLEGNFNGAYFQTDTAAPGITTVAGLGWGGQLGVQWEGKRWAWGAQWSLLEAMDWQESHVNYQFHVNEQYEGVSLVDVLQGETASSANIEDYVDTVSGAVAGARTSVVTIQVAHKSGPWRLALGARHIYQAGRVDYSADWGWQGQLVLVRTMSKGWQLQGDISVGGWAPFNVGMAVQKKFPFGLMVQLGSNHVASLVLPQQLPGTSYHALVGFAF